MTATLVYFLCAISAPTQCQQHEAPAPSVLACLSTAPAELAGPLAVPGWRVREWRCR